MMSRKLDCIDLVRDGCDVTHVMVELWYIGRVDSLTIETNSATVNSKQMCQLSRKVHSLTRDSEVE